MGPITWGSDIAPAFHTDLTLIRAEDETCAITEVKDACHLGCLVLNAPFIDCHQLTLASTLVQAEIITVREEEGYTCGLDSVGDGTNAQVLQDGGFAL